jgi:hypothetical protein
MVRFSMAFSHLLLIAPAHERKASTRRRRKKKKKKEKISRKYWLLKTMAQVGNSSQEEQMQSEHPHHHHHHDGQNSKDTEYAIAIRNERGTNALSVSETVLDLHDHIKATGDQKEPIVVPSASESTSKSSSTVKSEEMMISIHQSKQTVVVEEAINESKSQYMSEAKQRGGSNTSSPDRTTVQFQPTYTISSKAFPWILTSLLLSILLSAIDSTLPAALTNPLLKSSIATQTTLPWIFSSYLVTTSAFNLMYGKLADVFGRREVFVGALFVFAVGSAICGAAVDIVGLVIGRVIAGMGKLLKGTVLTRAAGFAFAFFVSFTYL